MILPKELAQAFIEHIDRAFLSYNENSGDKDNYLSHVDTHMNTAFNISWSKGGTYGNCYDDELTEAYEESEPEPTELINFLSKHYPELSEDNIEAICHNMSEDDEYDCDYYGGRTVQGNKKISFGTLADLLILMVYQEKGVYKDEIELINFNELIEEHSTLVINMNLQDYHKLNIYKELNKTLINEQNSTKRLKI